MKIDRLIGIITILLQRGKATAPELAEHFEVSRRTINRDIEDICRAGIPLVTTQGYGGGVSIADGYQINRFPLTQEDLLHLFSGLKGMGSVLKTPPGLAEKLSAKASDSSEDIVIVDLASHYRASLSKKAAVIKDAILDRHVISFRYYYEKGECQRRIEPYRLVFRWSSWYVWGYCLDRRAFRLFKLNRLWELESGPDTFAPRELPLREPDLDRHLAEGSIHLKAIFQESEKYRLIDEYGIDSCCAAEEKGLLFEWDFADYRNMREWVLSFGSHVEVLEPDSLRVELRQIGVDFLKKYRGT